VTGVQTCALPIYVAEQTFRIINMLDGQIVDESVTARAKAQAAIPGG